MHSSTLLIWYVEKFRFERNRMEVMDGESGKMVTY